MTSELLKLSTVGSVQIIELQLPDDLDSSEFDRLNEEVGGWIKPAAGKFWVVDLAQVQYMPSSGLGLLVNIRHQVKSQKGQISLCNLSSRLQGIFRACSLERLFTIHRTREDAVRAAR